MTPVIWKKIKWWVIIGVLILLGSGVMVVYSELETKLQAEQAKTEKITQKTVKLSKIMEQAQARVRTLEESRSESVREKRKLRASSTMLKAALHAEQAKTGKLTQKTVKLSKIVEQAQAQVKTLEKSRRASEREKRKLQAKGTKPETSLQELQATYEAEQAKTKRLTEKVERLSKTMKQAQARVKALEKSAGASEQEKGRLQAKGTKPETSLQELQTTYEAEQAKTEKLTRDMAAMLELVTRLRADLVMLHHALGVSYNRLGMNQEALTEFQAALKINPDHAESHLDLARVYIEYSDDSASAAPHFRKYVRLRPEARDAERIKGWLLTVEKELEMKSERERRSKGIFHALY